MKKVLTVVLALAMVLSCIAAFAGCSQTEPEETTVAENEAEPEFAYDVSGYAFDETKYADENVDIKNIKQEGRLLIGITDFAPMDYQDEKGEWIGFDADTAKAFAAYLGVEAEFVVIDWDSKEMELEGKTIDCVWNGMTLTEEVTTAMECSKAYADNAQVVVVNKDVADKYADAESCKELAFAVENGSAGEAMAKENGFNYTGVVDQATAVQEVAAGTSDAAIIDSLMAAAMVGEGTGFENLTYTVKLNSEQYGVGFRKGSDLAKALNEFFALAYADGQLAKCAEKYGIQASLIAQ